VVGQGNARVQVSAEMDFNRVSETSERFDPEGRVIRSTTTSEETSANGGQGGATTAGANVPDTSAGGASSSSGPANESSSETVNYEISHTTRTEVSEGGRIRRLSVAVAVDGVMTPGEGANAAPTYAPRSAEDMQRLTQLVRSAVGFNEQRGDIVEVVNTQFARAAAPAGAEEPGALAFLDGLDTMRIIEIVAALIASLAFVFFVLRPLVSGLMRGGANAAAAAAGGGAVPALPSGGGAAAALPPPDGGAESDDINIAEIGGRVRQSSVKKIGEVVSQYPDESAQIIRGWLNNAM
jgi:flagellar M-ring protein FliF